MPPPQQPPEAQGGGAACWLAPLVMAPAPPLMSLFTRPPHSGHCSIAASLIFCRFSKWQEHSSHRYS